MPYYVGVVQFSHDINLLIDVLLQEGLFLHVAFAYGLDGIMFVICF